MFVDFFFSLFLSFCFIDLFPCPCSALYYTGFSASDNDKAGLVVRRCKALVYFFFTVFSHAFLFGLARIYHAYLLSPFLLPYHEQQTDAATSLCICKGKKYQ
ncbi:hypothetical protein BDW68DRAFT_51840 [Aspergillus falconensis]